MLRLSTRQMNTATAQFQRDFDAQMMAMLIDKYQSVGPVRRENLIAYVSAARQQAQTLGFYAEQHIFDLVEACFIVGPGLWEAPDFQKIIAARMKTREDKAVAIRRRYVPDLEADAKMAPNHG